MGNWSASDIPSLAGRTVVVTGTGGLGFEDALELARHGASVILAGRNPAKGGESIRRLREAVPAGPVRFEVLDLASLASVRDFGARMRGQLTSLDLLINNAAVMAPAKRSTTEDGLELQFGTNYLGHFALTAELLPLLRAASAPRVVNVCSLVDRSAKMNLGDLQSERSYRPMDVYGQSKLANLMFSLELQRREGVALKSIAAHPGLARTEIIENGPGARSPLALMRKVLGRIMFQSPAEGALPTLFAATSPDAEGGAYYGPSGIGGMRGAPGLAGIPRLAEDAELRGRLWEASVRLTGAVFG